MILELLAYTLVDTTLVDTRATRVQLLTRPAKNKTNTHTDTVKVTDTDTRLHIFYVAPIFFLAFSLSLIFLGHGRPVLFVFFMEFSGEIDRDTEFASCASAI